MISQNRIVNLRKIFPYIPEKMNNVLLHFSLGAEIFYDTVEELYQEVNEALHEMR